MLLVEKDGKELFRAVGIPTPDSVLVADGQALPPLPGAGPWVVKAQVAAGGRGKAGGIRLCDDAAQVAEAARAIIGSTIRGHRVDACLVEQAVGRADEHYLSILLDPVDHGVFVTVLREGGMEVESHAPSERQVRRCALAVDDIARAIDELTADEAAPRRDGLRDVGRRLAQLFVEKELVLAEINPLFVSDSGCTAGDAKVVVDMNAIDRQPLIREIVVDRPQHYPDAKRKVRDGFDYVEVDPEGDVGLLTTGAGLSMMLVDELVQRGCRPMNFCDVRTGQLRGSPDRLIKVLGWIAARPSVRVLLVNIFAGITDLTEFARLLCAALEQVPALQVPVVVRLIGNGQQGASDVLAELRPDLLIDTSLSAALDRVAAAAGRS